MVMAKTPVKRKKSNKVAPTMGKGLFAPQNPFIKLYKTAEGAGGVDPLARQIGLANKKYEDPIDALIAKIQIAEAFEKIFDAYRYKVFYGGRGGAKSWGIARALIIISLTSKKRILCAREYMSSIKDSVMPLLVDQIKLMGLEAFFKTTKTSIFVPSTGSEFTFTGLRINPLEFKGFEGIDICWIEEGQAVSRESLEILKPTIRKEGSEIWISFNPLNENDPIYNDFVLHTPPNCLLVKVGYQDNPWFPSTLDEERLYMQQCDMDAYQWVWEGHCRKISDAVVFKGKFSIEPFETPANARFMYGADWGFGPDPTVLVRCFEKDKFLYVDAESYAFNLDLDKIAETWREAIPGCDKTHINADNAQPQTVKHVSTYGLKVRGPRKLKIEDGITFMRGYKGIIIHPRCYYTGQEFMLYKYKTDRISGEVLPVLIDKHNHCIDALRYALFDRIRRRGGVI